MSKINQEQAEAAEADFCSTMKKIRDDSEAFNRSMERQHRNFLIWVGAMLALCLLPAAASLYLALWRAL